MQIIFNLIILFCLNDKLKSKLFDKKPIDFIDYGWIEVSGNTTRYNVRCNDGYVVNSKNNLVKRQIVLDKNSKNKSFKDFATWVPIDGFSYKNLPLCYKKCKFQTYLYNGNVKINQKYSKLNTRYQIDKRPDQFIELIQGDSIKYECFDSYYLQKISLNPSMPLFKSSFKTQSKTHKCVDLKYESNESSSSEETSEPDVYYECHKYCKSIYFNTTNGFYAPMRSFYKPSDQIDFYCNDGYASEIVYFENSNQSHSISNKHMLECSKNGTWRVLITIKSNLTKSLVLSDKSLTCSSLETFFSQNESMNWIFDDDFNLNYNDLNYRTVTLIFSIVGFLILFLSLSLLIIRIYHLKNSNINYVNLNTGTRPEVETTPSFSPAENPQMFRTLSFGLISRNNDILRSTPRDNLTDSNSPPSYDQIFSSQPQSSVLTESPIESVQPRIELSIDRPVNRVRSNRVENARRIKNSSIMRKYKTNDKRRRTNGSSSSNVQGECSSLNS